jgi:ELMO domain-containing protein
MKQHHLEGINSLLSPCYQLMTSNYDENNEENINLLKKLWKNLKPEIELKEMNNDEWSDMGFQGKNPSTDFRGMGLLGLDVLVFITTHELPFVKKCIELREYPFAVTGINLIHLVMKMIKHENMLKGNSH